MKLLMPVFVAVGVTALNKAVTLGSLPARVLIGGFIYGGLILLAGEASMDVALAFAWVVAITAVLVNGPVVFESLSKAVK